MLRKMNFTAVGFCLIFAVFAAVIAFKLGYNKGVESTFNILQEDNIKAVSYEITKKAIYDNLANAVLCYSDTVNICSCESPEFKNISIDFDGSNYWLYYTKERVKVGQL